MLKNISSGTSQKISQKLIGYRVKAAREARQWTQDLLARGLGLKDRQSVSDIENGKRALKPEELLLLSELLEREIEFFIDPFAVAGEAQFSWRVAPEVSEDRLDEFELKAGQWIGLLRWLREQREGRASVLKRALRLSAQSSFEDAHERAESLVAELDLGMIPAETLIEKIEQELDIPVLFVDTINGDDDPSISGATCHIDQMGVILINRNESEARRYYDLAHELFHALTWDAMKPDHRESNSLADRNKDKRIEQLANNFGASLLMPRASLDQLIDPSRAHDIAHLCEVAALLRVAPVALAWRLFNLKLITKDTRHGLSRQKQRHSASGSPKRFSLTFVKMLYEALDNGRLSARKAAKAMGLGLGGLTELFTQYDLTAPFEL
ncbi:XRE family transcriptional regulator [Nitrosomonas communis]|uniref:Zn-dependent peptidase ImmA, M78 family n=1 Tax=Nitrosomonas communis TaxID=44574 RepID=A0A1I4LMM6_9PROT|nr:XRE family transcriptional regulator [Nitrosomonas communis]SFL92209.1 Zn-dependent peptidase ImmA, M78 family [Nitrosomonas communis]